MIISKFIILSLFVSVFYFIGFLSFITDQNENRCEMAYMFEYPQFVKISLDVEDLFPKYGLFAYSEGKLTERARAMKFNGIPVLFIPGNAGSYKQVRSLASVALRKALGSRVGYHFDFFTVDYNDELSGLNGAVLEEQTLFLNHSLYRVLDLYNKTKSSTPESVIVIGHSMLCLVPTLLQSYVTMLGSGISLNKGGVIAENLMVNSNYFRNIDLLLTLASPHRRPAIYLDNYISDYYDIAKRNNLKFDHFENKTFISVAAGFNDHLVNTWLTISNFSSINVVTTNIPTVGLSMDHACIVWCKQLIFTIIRALFDAVDLKTKQLSTNPNYRLAVFKHHLLTNSGVKARWLDRYKVITQLDERGHWREDIRRQYSVKLQKGTNQNLWYMVRIIDDPKQQALFVQAINLEVDDWIFTCNAGLIRGQSRYCDSGIHLSHLSKIAPSTRYKRRTHFVDLKKLKKKYPKVSHVVIRIPPTQEPVTLNVDIFNPSDRLVNITLPRWISMSRTTVIKQTDPEALRYEIQLFGLQHVIQTYLLYVEPIKCNLDTHHATVTFSVPWAQQDLHVYITETLRKPLQLRLHSSRPNDKFNLTAKVLLILDPACQYSISVRNSFFGMLAQFARFYSPLLLANIAAVILMSFRSQLVSLDEKGYCGLFQSSLSMSVKPYYLVTTAKLLSRLLSWNSVSTIIPIPDTQILVDENLDFLILPLLLYIIAVGLTYMLSVGLWTALILSESTVNAFVTKFITRTIGGAIKLSDWLLSALHRIPCVVAATLLCLGISTCGGLALGLGLAYYFLKLTQMCQDYLQGLALRYVKNIIFAITGKLFKKSKKIKTDEIVNKTEEETKVIEQKKEQLEEQCANDTVNKIKWDGSGDTETTLVQSELVQDDKVTEEQCENNEEVNEDNQINAVRLRNVKPSSSQENEVENKNVMEDKVVKEIENNEEDVKEIENIVEDVKAKEIKEEDKVYKKPEKSGNNSDNIHFHFTILLMWFIVALVNIPSVHTWAHNFQYSNVLKPDPSLECGIVLCTCAIALWQLELPKPKKKYYKQMSMFVYVMALLCLIYAPLHLYRLSQILCVTVSLTVIHQLLAPNLPEDEEEERADEPDPVALMTDIKSKLE